MVIMDTIIRGYKPYITLSPGHQLTAVLTNRNLALSNTIYTMHRWMDGPTFFYQLAKVI